MLTAMYALSAGLELLGIGLVVWEVRSDLARVRDLRARPRRARVPFPRMTGSIHGAIDDDVLRRSPDSMRAQMISRERRAQAERDLQRAALGAAEAELEAREEIAQLLQGRVFRRLLGPALVGLGIVIGAVVNIAAL